MYRLFVTLSLVLTVVVGGATAPRPGDADLLLFNGKVITVDRDFTVAQAVAIRGARILAVGGTRELMRFAGLATKRVDLRGRTVTPGFIDGHPHLFNVGDVPLNDVRSVGDILRVIEREAARRAPGQWIVTEPPGEPPYHFHMLSRLAEGRYPSLRELDEAAPRNPVYIKSSPFDERPTALFNSKALEALGVTKENGPIAGVEIVRGADGVPLGQVVGNLSYFSRSPLRDKLFALSPRPSFEAQLAELKRDMRDFNAGGVTAIYEGHGMPDSTIELYRELWGRGEMTVRSYLVKTLDPSKPLDSVKAELGRMTVFRGGGFGDDFLKIGGICLEFGDNVGFGAGFMREPYTGPEGRKWQGIQRIPTDRLYEIARAAAQQNIRVNVQASGGKAIDITLDIFERINKETPIAGRRFVIEHCQFPSEQNMRDAARLGVVPTTVTNFLWGQGRAYRRFYGEELARHAVPLRGWLRHGVPVVQSTDYGPHHAMFTLWQSLARKDGWTGETLGTDESISREDAIRVYTINGARLAFWEDEIGSLEEGKLADLVVLDRDILTCPLDDIRSTKVLATLVGGKVVYGSLTN